MIDGFGRLAVEQQMLLLLLRSDSGSSPTWNLALPAVAAVEEVVGEGEGSGQMHRLHHPTLRWHYCQR